MEEGRDHDWIERRILHVLRLLDELGDQLEPLLRASRARSPERFGTDPSSRCAESLLHLAEHRRLESPVSREPRSSGPTRTVLATARYGFSRPLPPSARSISPARRSILTWKCRWPGSTSSLCASSLFVSGSPPSPPSISSTRKPQRMAESLELLGSLDGEDVAGVRGRGLRHIEPTYRISGAVVKPGGGRAVEQHDRLAPLGAEEARRRLGIRLACERTRRRRPPLPPRRRGRPPAPLRRAWARSSSRARPRSCGTATARRSRSSRACELGKSDAVWPSGPIPCSARPSSTPSRSRSYSAAAASPPSSPRTRCTSEGCRSSRSSSVRLTSR